MKPKMRFKRLMPNTIAYKAKASGLRDITQTLYYFINKEGTMRDCANATGIAINSITWYIKYLREEGWLVATRKAADRTTGRLAVYYTLIGQAPKVVQLDLFAEGGAL